MKICTVNIQRSNVYANKDLTHVSYTGTYIYKHPRGIYQTDVYHVDTCHISRKQEYIYIQTYSTQIQIEDRYKPHR